MFGLKKKRLTYHAVTKAITLDVPPMRLLMFLRAVGTWPRWNLLQVDGVRQVSDDRWDLGTRMGKLELRFRRNAVAGTIEYQFSRGPDRWILPGRILANGEGCELVLTLFQYPGMPRAIFDGIVYQADDELAWLKRLVELE